MPHISTVDVVTRIAARLPDHDIKNRDGGSVIDRALLAWFKRDRAARLILEALRSADLTAWAQLASNPPVQLTSIDWAATAFGHDTIISGSVRAALGERIARFEDAAVLLDTDEAWLKRQLVEDMPAGDTEAANESPASAPETLVAAAPPGPKPGGGQSPKRRCAEEAKKILDDETQRPPRGKGRKIAVARLLCRRLSLLHRAETVSRYISQFVSEWERLHPDQ